MVVPLVVIGAALMVLGAVSSVIQGYGAVLAGASSSASVISGVLMRVAGLALLMGSWHTLVPIGVDVANAFSGYVLSDQAINDALAKTFGLTAAGGATAGIAAASGVAPIVLVILLVLMAMFFVALLLLKYVVTFAFAVLYLGGPSDARPRRVPRAGKRRAELPRAQPRDLDRDPAVMGDRVRGLGGGEQRRS